MAGVPLWPREAATALILLAGMAVDGTRRGVGPFVRETANESLLMLQGFMDIASVTTLVFGALVGQRRRVEAQLRRLSVSDAPTGLGNYRYLMAVLQGEISPLGPDRAPMRDCVSRRGSAEEHERPVGACGGQPGVVPAGRGVAALVPGDGHGARFGGDAFAIVPPEADVAAAQQVARRVQERLAQDVEEPPVSVSLGFSVYPRDGATVEALVGRADRILYQLKGRDDVTQDMFGARKELS